MTKNGSFLKVLSFLFSFYLLVPALSRGAASTLHSNVEVGSKPNGKNLNLDFKVKAEEGLILNMEAPWQLKIKDESNLNLNKSTYTKAEWDDQLPGFRINGQIQSEGKPVSLNYTLTAFACTSDKKVCYRDVHESTFTWVK